MKMSLADSQQRPRIRANHKHVVLRLAPPLGVRPDPLPPRHSAPGAGRPGRSSEGLPMSIPSVRGGWRVALPGLAVVPLWLLSQAWLGPRQDLRFRDVRELKAWAAGR